MKIPPIRGVSCLLYVSGNLRVPLRPQKKRSAEDACAVLFHAGFVLGLPSACAGAAQGHPGQLRDQFRMLIAEARSLTFRAGTPAQVVSLSKIDFTTTAFAPIATPSAICIFPMILAPEPR